MSTFMLDLQRFAEKTQDRADEVVGRIVANIAKELDELSPVGDATYWKHKPPKGYVGGRFRGNWQLGVDTIPAGETGRIDPAGGPTLGAIVSEIPTEAAGRVYYLANNVPYAQRIEEGWSRQAPAGLVGRTVVRWQQIVAQAAGTAQ